jgi:hypothetical protein
MGDYMEYRDGWQMPRASDVRVIHPDGTEEIKPRGTFVAQSRAGRELRRKTRAKPMRAYSIKPKRRAKFST